MKNPFVNFNGKHILCLFVFLSMIGCDSQTKDGIQKSYYETGILKSVESYQNGALNGISRKYYEAGILKHAINYKNDRIDGMYHTYYPSGALWTQKIYDDGVYVGRKEYNEEGAVTKEEGFNKI